VLAKDPFHARPIVFGLLTNRVTIVPNGHKRWTMRAEGTLKGLFEREIFPSGWRPQRDSVPLAHANGVRRKREDRWGQPSPKAMASPTGFEPVFWP
jgi:hypothetical protein